MLPGILIGSARPALMWVAASTWEYVPVPIHKLTGEPTLVRLSEGESIEFGPDCPARTGANPYLTISSNSTSNTRVEPGLIVGGAPRSP